MEDECDEPTTLSEAEDDVLRRGRKRVLCSDCGEKGRPEAVVNCGRSAVGTDDDGSCTRWTLDVGSGAANASVSKLAVVTGTLSEAQESEETASTTSADAVEAEVKGPDAAVTAEDVDEGDEMLVDDEVDVAGHVKTEDNADGVGNEDADKVDDNGGGGGGGGTAEGEAEGLEEEEEEEGAPARTATEGTTEEESGAGGTVSRLRRAC